jgi:hypothetical protein
MKLAIVDFIEFERRRRNFNLEGSAKSVESEELKLGCGYGLRIVRATVRIDGANSMGSTILQEGINRTERPVRA